MSDSNCRTLNLTLECELDGQVFWDGKFPCTHKVTALALNELDAIYGTSRPLSTVLNVSPGIPTQRQIDKLRKKADSYGTKRYRLKKGWRKAREIFHASDFGKPRSRRGSAVQADPPAPMQLGHRRFRSDPNPLSKRTATDSSDSSTSTMATKTENKLQDDIRLILDERYGANEMYHRLAYQAPEPELADPKLYLSDVGQPKHVLELARKFLDQPSTKETIQKVTRGWDKTYRQRQSGKRSPDEAGSQSSSHVDCAKVREDKGVTVPLYGGHSSNAVEGETRMTVT